MPRNAETRLREADDYRAVLHESRLAQVVDSSVSSGSPPPRGYEQGYQVALAYFGLFKYNIGHRGWLIDPNRTLFISPGWEYCDEHPVRGLGHASVLVNPSREVLDEICGWPGPNKNSAFMVASRPATMRLRLLTHHILEAAYGWSDPLHNDEWVVHVLHEAINGPPVSAPRASRTVERAKQLLHARGCERLALDEIARQVGVSAVYLTQEFARSEGVPLYRYQLRLRLSRALLELPHCDDITGLALDLGFSSHSHFTASFRQAFGLSPSEYRSSIGLMRLTPTQGIAGSVPIRHVA
jgi:AraC-like DNA-binding protein